MKATWVPRMPRGGVWTWVVWGVLLGIGGWVVAAPGPAYAANPAPAEVFYVTLPETDGLTALDAINVAATPPMSTYFSIAVAVSDTLVYYDQWENGYDADIANPANLYSSANLGGTQVWGNRTAADGCAPNIKGVAVTCTDANDVLRAGDVIIPYNAVPLTVGTPPYNVLDHFSTAAYNRNDGNVNWASNWMETGDDNNAASGTIYIQTGGLRFRYLYMNSVQNDSIDRGVDLSAAGACATLSFTLGQSGIDATGDSLAVQISSDGTSYTTLGTFSSSNGTGAKSYLILGYATANTRVRFVAQESLETGEYWTVDDVKIEWGCGFIRDSGVIRFDGRDKVAASNSIAMVRATWASGSGTLNAFAHEMYNTAEWGTAYEAPVGTNTASAGQMFEYSALSIMASQNNTQVQIDANADGAYETTVTLQEGGSYLAAGTRQGARVQADKPVQVVLVTGDVGSNYASRDMTLLPVSSYGSSYWSPVGVTNTINYPTRLFLYNPSSNGSIYVTCQRRSVADIRLGPILAREVVTVDLTDNQAAHCYASDSSGTATTDKIFGIGTVDTANTAYDWSFTLFPDSFLTTDALVGLGLGRDPTSATSPTQNGSPLWVTSVCNTYVYVDWNNDGTADRADLNGDGDTGDTVDGIAEGTTNNGFPVTALQSVRLFEPNSDAEPYDQSGARVWSRTASGVGYGGAPGCKLTVAWGEDPHVASAADPGLDVGTAVPPLRLSEGGKALALKVDADGDGLLSPGDTVTYTITVRNAGGGEIENVHVYDTVPLSTTYIPATTEKNVGSGWTSIPDDGIGDGFPLDVTGGVLLGNLAEGATFYVHFNVVLGSGSSEYEQLSNCSASTSGAGSLRSCAIIPAATKDWGDLPDTYGTSTAADGPRHSPSGLTLGARFDRELHGAPSASALGDDAAASSDEDGVVLAGDQAGWWNGSGAFSVTVSGTSGCLNAWMDFTNDAGSGAGTAYADGNFTKTVGYDTYTTTEHIIDNTLVPTGTTQVAVSVPRGLNVGTSPSYYFRFRLSPTVGGACATAIGPTGAVIGGEVEDYLFNLANAPTAVDLASFMAKGGKDAITVSWRTLSEADTLGFNLYRAESAGGVPTKLNDAPIPAQVPGQSVGAAYEYVDAAVTRGVTYYYWLEEIDLGVVPTGLSKPVAASLGGPIYLPMVVKGP